MGSEERRIKEKEIRRNDIIEAAERVFFAKGYKQATVDDVAAAAEFSKRTVYVYFTSKEQIYFEVMIRGYRHLLDRLRQSVREGYEGTAVDRLKEMGNILYGFSKEHPEYFTAIIEYETAEVDFDKGITDQSREECYALGEELTGMFQEILQRGIHEGVIRKELNVSRTVLVLWANVIGVLNTARKKENYIRNMHSVTPDELVEAAFDLMVHSIQAQEGSE